MEWYDMHVAEIETFDPANVPSSVEVGRNISVEFLEVIGGGSGGGGGGGSGTEILDIQAAEDIPAYTFITITGFKVNSANMAHYGKTVGIVQLATSSGFIAEAVDEGEITNNTWTWSPGAKLFINGTLISATPPASGFSQMVAIARDAHTIIVRLEPPILL
jgi:hypothetical protein